MPRPKKPPADSLPAPEGGKEATKPASGGKRATRDGRKVMLLSWTPEERAAIEAAAAAEGRAMAGFVRFHALQVARRINKQAERP